jgi:hypothetical protein
MGSAVLAPVGKIVASPVRDDFPLDELRKTSIRHPANASSAPTCLSETVTGRIAT